MGHQKTIIDYLSKVGEANKLKLIKKLRKQNGVFLYVCKHTGKLYLKFLNKVNPEIPQPEEQDDRWDIRHECEMMDREEYQEHKENMSSFDDF